jgi:multidrug efflux pump subunit AcrA (membrane-fusion protein)
MHTEIDVENSNGTLKDGMYAEAKIGLNQQSNALTVPVQAVERNGSGASVLMVDAQGRVEEKQVKLGVESSDRVEVLTGLTENDQIIIGNRGEFRDGEVVRPRVVNESVSAEGTN